MIWLFYSLAYYFAWLVGILSFIQFAIGTAHFLNKHLLRKPKNLIERFGEGTWAVVTGATGGIGEEFCKQLGQKGFNIVLMSRSKAKLEESELKLKRACPHIKTRIVQADFSESASPEFYQDIYKQLKDLDISFLVNNAGIAMFKFFNQVDPKELQDMIQTNCSSYSMLTHSLINQLLGREKRSGIINVASIAGFSPTMYQGCYAATKRFVRFFTYSLHDNYKHKIDTIALNPGFVETKMIQHTNADMVCTPEQTVTGCLRDIGYDVETSAYWLHDIQAQTVEMSYRHFYKLWRFGIRDVMQLCTLRVYKETNEAKKKH